MSSTRIRSRRGRGRVRAGSAFPARGAAPAAEAPRPAETGHRERSEKVVRDRVARMPFETGRRQAPIQNLPDSSVELEQHGGQAA